MHESVRIHVRTPEGSYSAVAVRKGDKTLVSFKGRQYSVERSSALGAGGQPMAPGGELRAPMHGQIVDVLVSQGDTVEKGQRLLILEAMKTQLPFSAPFDGIVALLPAAMGHSVAEGDLLARVEEVGKPKP